MSVRVTAPFCKNMYLDMVNTTGGAIAWAFLKPMLMGQILFSPDTPLTRDIMEKVQPQPFIPNQIISNFIYIVYINDKL